MVAHGVQPRRSAAGVAGGELKDGNRILPHDRLGVVVCKLESKGAGWRNTGGNWDTLEAGGLKPLEATGWKPVGRTGWKPVFRVVRAKFSTLAVVRGVPVFANPPAGDRALVGTRLYGA